MHPPVPIPHALRLNPDSGAEGASSWTHLGEVPKGGRARVTGFELPPAKTHRLLEMGFIPGTVIHVIRFAPLGDPIEVRVRGYHLSLRRSEARGILVEAVL